MAVAGVVEGTFVGAKGVKIFTRRFEKVEGSSPRGVVFAHHGLHGHANFEWLEMGKTYRDEYHGSVVEELNKLGLVVCQHDHRGHGRSAGTRALLELPLVYEDAQTFVDLTLKENPSFASLPIYLLGISLGGLVSMNVWTRNKEIYKGMVLLSPAMGVGRSMTGPLYSLAEAVVDFIGPVFPTFPTVSIPKSLNATIREQFIEDPLTWKGKVLLRTAYDMLKEYEKIPTDQISCQVLILYGALDGVVSVEDGREHFDQIPSEDKQIEFLEGCRHALLHEEGSEKARQMLLQWLTTRIQKS